jgi:hypothetical protein
MVIAVDVPEMTVPTNASEYSPAHNATQVCCIDTLLCSIFLFFFITILDGKGLYYLN